MALGLPRREIRISAPLWRIPGPVHGVAAAPGRIDQPARSVAHESIDSKGPKIGRAWFHKRDHGVEARVLIVPAPTVEKPVDQDDQAEKDGVNSQPTGWNGSFLHVIRLSG